MVSGGLVFTVDGSVATPASPISLAEAGFRERSDLQEWIISHPRILGADVLIVTFEFDRWWASGGTRERDRLDVLGIDADGRLVVAELKRDQAPDTVEMQAIKYAAMASRFTEDTLVEQFARFRSHRGEPEDEESARQVLLDHVGEIDPEVFRAPRIILVAGSFPPVVTSTVVWLSDMGLDITLQQVQAYRVFGDQTIVSVSQLFPVPDVEEFQVSPQRAQVQAVVERQRRRGEGAAVVRLVSEGLIPDGTALDFVIAAAVTPQVRQAVEAWIAEDPRRGRATWFNQRRAPIEWAMDGKRYRPTPLAQKILAEAAGVPGRTLRGPLWWVLPDGRNLPGVLGDAVGFDWAPFHEVMANLPGGRWTTYGDLAERVGTAAMPVGQHVAGCQTCENAWRVLGTDGKTRAGFAWSDPADTRTQEDVLAREGVRFDHGVADSSQRLSRDELSVIGSEASR